MIHTITHDGKLWIFHVFEVGIVIVLISWDFFAVNTNIINIL